MILLWIVVILALFSVGSAYAFNQTEVYVLSNLDGMKMNQIVDTCKANYSTNNQPLLDACTRFIAAFHKHMTNLYTETKDDIIKILVGP